jgi:hypothetical protein
LLADPNLAGRMGITAQDRVRQGFLGPRHLIQYVDLLAALVADPQDKG